MRSPSRPGGTEHVVKELERSVHDALRVTATLSRTGSWSRAGRPRGGTRLQLSGTDLLGGREQSQSRRLRRRSRLSPSLAVTPRWTLSICGRPPVAHERGKKTWCLDLAKGAPADMLKAGWWSRSGVKQHGNERGRGRDHAPPYRRYHCGIAKRQAGVSFPEARGDGRMPPGNGEY
jgi:hypothetical protein